MRLFVAHISFFTSELVKSCWSWSEVLVSVLSYCGHSIYSHTNNQTHGVTHFAIEVQYKNLIDVLAVAMRRIYIFRFSFAVF